MIFLVFYFLIFTVLVFQGTHMAGEVRTPLGTLPEEVGQRPVDASRWGLLLVTVGLLGAVLGLIGFSSPAAAAARPAFLGIALAVLAGFGIWVVFFGRKPEFIGKAAVADDHGHGHH